MIINLRKHKLLNHPILGLFLLVLWGEFFVQFGGLIFGFFVYNLENNLLKEMIGSILTILYAVVAYIIYKLWFQGQFKGAFSNKGIIIGILYLLIPFLVMSMNNILTLDEFGNPFVAIVLGTAPGISEELVFRAMPLSNAMRNCKNGLWLCIYVFINGCIFGSVHLLNYFFGAGWGATLAQAIYATGFGILFGAVYVRTANIIPCIFIHSLIDIIALLDASLQESSGILETVDFNLSILISSLILFLVPFAFALLILRPSKHTEILNLWKTKWLLIK